MTRAPARRVSSTSRALLVDELHELGLGDAQLDEQGFVFATLEGVGPVIGLIAHVDTSPEVSGAGVEPIVHRAYDGGVIALPRDDVVLDPAEMPGLADKAGEDVVTASGDTLLGADDKAGVAEIMAAIAHLVAHPDLPRPTLRIAFTPDEEIGEGAKRFDVERFGARCAYTLDGSTIGELQDETFSGDEAIVTIHGVDVHPGFAEGILVSAIRVAGAVLAALPPELSPERTSGRSGYIHPFTIEGGTAKATIRFIVRDFDDDLLAERVALLQRIAQDVVAAHPGARLEFSSRRSTPTCANTWPRSPRSDKAPRGDPCRGHRADRRADPRRNRRIAAQRDGPADAEHLRRRPRLPLAARVGDGPGHGGGRGDDRAPGRRVGAAGRALSLTPKTFSRSASFSADSPVDPRTAGAAGLGHDSQIGRSIRRAWAAWWQPTSRRTDA